MSGRGVSEELKGQHDMAGGQRVSEVVSWPELNPGPEAVASSMGDC